MKKIFAALGAALLSVSAAHAQSQPVTVVVDHADRLIVQTVTSMMGGLITIPQNVDVVDGTNNIMVVAEQPLNFITSSQEYVITSVKENDAEVPISDPNMVSVYITSGYDKVITVTTALAGSGGGGDDPEPPRAGRDGACQL